VHYKHSAAPGCKKRWFALDPRSNNIFIYFINLSVVEKTKDYRERCVIRTLMIDLYSQLGGQFSYSITFIFDYTCLHILLRTPKYLCRDIPNIHCKREHHVPLFFYSTTQLSKNQLHTQICERFLKVPQKSKKHNKKTNVIIFSITF